MPVRTITLKLHKPGRIKREILDTAMRNYSMAFQFLLDQAAAREDEIMELCRDGRGPYRPRSIEKWIDGDLGSRLNRFDIQPFKDSLKMDFGMTMAGYLALKSKDSGAGRPVAYLSSADWAAENERLFTELEGGRLSPRDYTRAVERLGAKDSVVRPLFFCRNAGNRDYSLLYDSSRNRYYAKLYLMNAKNAAAAEDCGIKPGKELRYICRGKTVLEPAKGKRRFLLFPLSFGRWQEGFLEKAQERPELLKTARLIKKQSEYFLAVNMELPQADKIEATAFLGVSRGIRNALNYCVSDSGGNIILRGGIPRAGLPGTGYRPIPGNECHTMANKLGKIACEHKAQVILQQSGTKSDNLRWTDRNGYTVKPAISCADYKKLSDILEYKLPEYGLPEPVKVSPRGIFHRCPACGLTSIKNRMTGEFFICVGCGTATELEKLGSENLAKRLLLYRAGYLDIYMEKTARGVELYNKDLGLQCLAENPQDCVKVLKNEIERMIRDFRQNTGSLKKSVDFNKKYSIIKRLENETDFTKCINVYIT